jgi:hypothetical protein
MEHTVFLAHARREQPMAHALRRLLEERGIVCCSQPGDDVAADWLEWDVSCAIRECRMLVYLCRSLAEHSPGALRQLSLAAELGRDILILREDEVHSGGGTIGSAALASFVDRVRQRLGLLPESALAPSARVAVHFGYFVASGARCCFINVTNLNPFEEIEVERVWLEFEPPVFALPPDRPLPKRLQPFETWETWVPMSRFPARLPAEAECYGAARARLSNGEVMHSVENIGVAQRGSIPGGPVLCVPRFRPL